MSRRPARVTEADINRALRAAAKVGDHLAVDIQPDGTIRIAPVSTTPEKNSPKRKNIVL